MTNKDITNGAILGKLGVLSDELPNFFYIVKLARRKDKLNEDFANGFIETDEFDKKDARIKATINTQIDKLNEEAKRKKYFVLFQNDPRGYAATIKICASDKPFIMLDITPYFYK